MKTHPRLASVAITLLAAWTVGQADASALEPGKTVWNRAIYRLARADGTSFRVDCLEPLKVVRAVSADEIWFEAEGRGEGRISDTDVARIAKARAEGKLPEGWSWVFETDPRTLHPEWDEKFWKVIADRSITQEMLPEMVRIVFGEPDKINVNPRPESMQEHWIYPTGSIWFVDGKVFTWQAP